MPWICQGLRLNCGGLEAHELLAVFVPQRQRFLKAIQRAGENLVLTSGIMAAFSIFLLSESNATPAKETMLTSKTLAKT